MVTFFTLSYPRTEQNLALELDRARFCYEYRCIYLEFRIITSSDILPKITRSLEVKTTKGSAYYALPFCVFIICKMIY